MWSLIINGLSLAGAALGVYSAYSAVSTVKSGLNNFVNKLLGFDYWGKIALEDPLAKAVFWSIAGLLLFTIFYGKAVHWGYMKPNPLVQKFLLWSLPLAAFAFAGFHIKRSSTKKEDPYAHFANATDDIKLGKTLEALKLKTGKSFREHFADNPKLVHTFIGMRLPQTVYNYMAANLSKGVLARYDKFSETLPPLHYAARINNVEACRALAKAVNVTRQAEIFSDSKESMNAVAYAARCKNWDSYEVLLAIARREFGATWDPETGKIL